MSPDLAAMIEVAPSGWEGRGLKPGDRVYNGARVCRSFRLGGAWIETSWLCAGAQSTGVAPSGWEGRGLKHPMNPREIEAAGSLLPVGRGVD